MAGGLPKSPDEFCKIPGARIAILGSMWHSECVDAQIARAQGLLLGLGVKQEDLCIHHVPGALEIPYAAARLFNLDPNLDAILAFGVVLKGITSHDETVVHNVSQRLGELSDRVGKPVINEVIGVKDIVDAQKRSANDEFNKGVEAVFAVSEVLSWRDGLVEKRGMGFGS